ncbi:MAG: hypothetical protein JW716_05520 [Candidatus Aenigmarchaeota archaeon]|nr:hypothetical protein [Candidatus Aenigmarchaeota archaeon]
MYSWERGNRNHKKPHSQGLEIPCAVSDVLDCYQYRPPSAEIDSSHYPNPFNVAVVRTKRAGSYAWELVSHQKEGRLKDILREQSRAADGYKVFVLYTNINKQGMETIERTVGHHRGKNPPEGCDSVLSHQTAKDVDVQVENIRKEISRIRNRWDALEL